MDPLLEFFRNYRGEVDLFCLQEVWDARHAEPGSMEKAPPGTRGEVFSEIEKVLNGFRGYFAPAQDNAAGVAIFIRRGVPVRKEGDVLVFRSRNAMVGNDGRTLGRNLQFIQFSEGDREYTVCHFHGLWTGEGKTDTESRIEQSQKIKAFLGRLDGPKILCGDFNLLPHTRSMTILESGMRNLVKENGITSTRSDFYTKAHPFADYILVSREVDVRKFHVIQETVSDHLPLFLEFF